MLSKVSANDRSLPGRTHRTGHRSRDLYFSGQALDMSARALRRSYVPVGRIRSCRFQDYRCHGRFLRLKTSFPIGVANRSASQHDDCAGHERRKSHDKHAITVVPGRRFSRGAFAYGSSKTLSGPNIRSGELQADSGINSENSLPVGRQFILTTRKGDDR